MANLGDTTIYGDLNVINNENIQGNLNLVGSFGIGGYPTVSSLDVYGSQSTEPLIQSYFSSSANAGGIGLNGVTQSHTRYFINGTLKWQTRVRNTDVFSIYSFTSASDVVSVSTSGTLTATTFSGSGASLTTLNASNLSSGTVPNARITGAYTGITTLTCTTSVTAPTVNATTGFKLNNTATSAQYLRGNGTNIVLSAIQASDVPILNQNTTGSAGSVPGTGVTGTTLASNVVTSSLTTVGVLASGSITTTFGNINIGTSTFTGNGSGLTALNASNLSSGTVPDARITGAYTGITNLTLSGYIDFGSTASDKLKLYGTTYSIGIESGTLYYKTGTTHRFYTGTTNLAEITTSGLNLKSGSYTGNGSGLTTLNASNLSSGTVPDARITGAYTGITTLTCTSTVQGTRFISTQATGTSPFSVASTTVNSNLNADMVDGYHVSTTANAANSIPVRDANGYLKVGWINTTSGSTTSAIARIYASNDAYIRYYTPGEFANQIKPYLESSTSYSIGGKFSLQYNSTTDALDFVYIG